MVVKAAKKTLKKFTKETARTITWYDYIQILSENATGTWFSGSWDEHQKKVNQFLEKKNIIPLEQYALRDEQITSELLTKMAFSDGKIVMDERKFIQDINGTFLEGESFEIKQSKLERKFDVTSKQIFIFYLLINIALSDKELAGEEIDLLCTLSGFLGITNQILELLNIYRDVYAKSSQPQQKKVFTTFDNGKQQILESVQKIESMFHTGNSDTDGNVEFEKRRDEILEVVLRMRESGNDKRICDQLKAIAYQVGNGRLSIGVVGITSSGKTTLMNALLGENLLPESVKPTTNCEVRVRRSAERRATVTFFNDKQQIWKGESLIQKLKNATNEETNPGNQMDIESIELEHPGFLLPESLEMVDTPGLNALGHEEHAEVTMTQVLPQLDMIVYLTTITNALKKVDMDFIRIARKRMTNDQKLLFVITCKGKEKNTKNVTKEKKWNKQIQRLRNDLDENGLGEDKAAIALVDNLWGQWGRLGHLQAWKDSGFTEMLGLLSGYAQDLRNAWLYLQSKKALELLQDKVFLPIDAKLSDDTVKSENAKKELDVKITNVAKVLKTISSEYSDMEKKYSSIKNALNFNLKKPDDKNDFINIYKKLESISTRSLNDILKILDERSKSAKGQLSDVSIMPVARRECVRKPSLPNQPKSYTEKRYVKKGGAWNWLKGLFDQEDYETHYDFNAEKSHKSLINYRTKLLQNVQEFEKSSLREYQRKYVKIVEQELANIKSNRESFDRRTDSMDIALEDHKYLKNKVSMWSDDVEDQHNFLESTNPERTISTIKKTQTGNREIIRHHHIPTQLKKTRIYKQNLVLFGGQLHQGLSWFQEAYNINTSEKNLESDPFWITKPPKQFPKKFPVSGSTQNFPGFSGLIYPENYDTISLPGAIIDHIIKEPNWAIGIHVDINRIGSGLSDVNSVFGGEISILTKLADMGKIFFWNIDMAHFETCDRLFELITSVRELLTEEPYSKIPAFFSEGGDLRWSYLLGFANEWRKKPHIRSYFSRQWSHNEYSSSAPFLPAALAELDNQFAQHLRMNDID